MAPCRRRPIPRYPSTRSSRACRRLRNPLPSGAYPVLHGGQDTPYPYFSDIGYLATRPPISAGLLSFRRSAGLTTPAWGWALALVLLVGSGYWTFLPNHEGVTGSWIDIGWMLDFGLIAWAAATTRQMLR